MSSGGGGGSSSFFLGLLKIATNVFCMAWGRGNGGVVLSRERNICPPVVRYNRRQETVGPRYSMLLEIMEQYCEVSVFVSIYRIVYLCKITSVYWT